MNKKHSRVGKFRQLIARKKFLVIMVNIGILAIAGTIIAVNLQDLNMKADIAPTPDLLVSQTSVTYEGAKGVTRTVKSNPVQAIINNSDFKFTESGWYLMALPKKPTNPDPASIFNGLTIDGSLYRWKTDSQGLALYDQWSEPGGDFGTLDTGVGFWLHLSPNDLNKVLSYSGTAETTAKTMSLKMAASIKKGWAIIGNPFDHPIAVNEKLFITDTAVSPNVTKNFCEATKAGWVTDVLYGWDYKLQGFQTAGCEFADTTILGKAQGYWMQMLKNGLTLEMRP